MPAELDPVIDQWYWHRDKGQSFYVIDIDDVAQTVDVQHFDGDLEAISLVEWRDLDIELGEAPENWTGPMDSPNFEDLQVQVSDTSPKDWVEPLNDYHESADGPEGSASAALDTDDFNEGDLPRMSMGAGPALEDEFMSHPDEPDLVHRSDGIYEERLGGAWLAQFFTDAKSGLWSAVLFKHDVPEWRRQDFDSLAEARQMARAYCDDQGG